MSTMPAPTTIGLCLEPLDVLFFRDGRPFTGSERSVSGLPLPQTFAGAIRTALLRTAGCDFPALGGTMKNGAPFPEAVKRACAEEYHWIGEVTVRGPWLARSVADDKTVEILLPAPATLHREKKDHKKLHRVSPLPKGQLPGWNPSAGQENLRPLWSKQLAASELAEGYLTRTGLEQFLHGDDVASDAVIPSSELFGWDYRTGIGISPNRLVAEESQIFGRGFLALQKDVFLYAEVVPPAETGKNELLSEIATLPLGGEGRHALLHHLEKAYDWPPPQPQRAKQKPLVLLTTPCVFTDGWKPQSLDGHLVAAAVPSSLAFSGWDLARGGPKPTRFAVPAGSVYFLEALPNNWSQSLAENNEDDQQGWGCCLTGVWTDE